MAISTSIHQLISKGRFDEIEDQWLGLLEERADDLDYFVGVARAMVGVGEEKRAGVLLEMLDEQFKNKKSWGLRLELLRDGGEIFLENKLLHDEILETLRQLHPGLELLEKFFVTVNLDKATDDLPKTWDKVDRLRELLQFTKGVPVELQGRGAGRIAEINLELESFKVDLEIVNGLKVGFRAASKMMRLLPEEHILYRKLVDPDSVAALRDDHKPPELLKAVLLSYDEPLSGAQIKETLRGVIDASKWSSWWTSARKHPNVVASVGGRQSYTWAKTGEQAAESLLATFQRAKTKEKISLFKKNADRNADLRDGMSKTLIELAETEWQKSPPTALEIWHALDRNSLAPAEAEWRPERLVDQASEASSLFGKLKDRTLRQSIYELIIERREDWFDRLPELLGKEEDAKLLEHVSQLLKAKEPALFDRLVDDLMSNARKKPAAFTWLAEIAGEREEILARQPLRLLQQVLILLGQDDLGPIRKRLEALFESGKTVARTLPLLDASQASRAMQAIERSPLADFEQTPLLNAIKLRFPDLDETEDQSLYALTSSIEAKREELKKLVEVEIPENRVAIETARAHGDLRENFEYHAARQRHEYLSARSAALNADLQRSRPIDLENTDFSEVRIGARVGLDGAEDPRDLSILGPWESDPDGGVISYESEIGKVVLGKAVGDELEIDGETYKIATIEAYSK